MNGKTSMVMTVDREIRDFLSLIPREIIAFRCRMVKGHRIIIGEKIPMHAVANPAAMLADYVPEVEK